ncbi:Arm DNA-binding domain-containing protein [Ruminococcus sp.]|uniref:Arm DNA-binding domain-containing protein n=1 Tax=Ruminococcus sp. TaxID=41978 RepID=UPI003AB8F514
MAVYKEEKTNTWRVLYRYTDWNGERKQTQKRGFKTKREAQSWEREQLNKLGGDLDMNFKSFVEHYSEDMQTRLKENTWETKKHIIDKKLVPYFGKLKMCNITAQQIITWQNELINYKDDKGKPYSPVYLKTIHNQLSAIFNHAVRYYNLKENPCQKAGSMGKKKNREMLFWTKDEYLKFADVMMDKPLSYYAFEMLYWTGIREGDDDDKIRLNQRKPSKYKGLRRFGPEKNLQRINKFMKERPIFYKNLIQMKENIRFYLRCFYCITKVMILQFNSENRTELARNG